MKSLSFLFLIPVVYGSSLPHSEQGVTGYPLDKAMPQILEAIRANTLLLFDIDGTSVQQESKPGEPDYSGGEVLDKTLVELIAKAQETTGAVFAFSSMHNSSDEAKGARGGLDTISTRHQVLQNSGIDFERSGLTSEIEFSCVIQDGENFYNPKFKKGILVTDGYYKRILPLFLKSIEKVFKPKQVMFFDDRFDNILTAGSGFVGSGIKYTGYLYKWQKGKGYISDPINTQALSDISPNPWDENFWLPTQGSGIWL